MKPEGVLGRESVPEARGSEMPLQQSQLPCKLLSVSGESGDGGSAWPAVERLGRCGDSAKTKASRSLLAAAPFALLGEVPDRSTASGRSAPGKEERKKEKKTPMGKGTKGRFSTSRWTAPSSLSNLGSERQGTKSRRA